MCPRRFAALLGLIGLDKFGTQRQDMAVGGELDCVVTDAVTSQPTATIDIKVSFLQ